MDLFQESPLAFLGLSAKDKEYSKIDLFRCIFLKNGGNLFL